jgi:arylsulfatase A-like enzyme
MRCTLVVALALAGCGPEATVPAPARAPRPPGWQVDRVVLVTVDGVRWQDMAPALEGRGPVELPALRRLAARGVALVGDIESSAPFPVSLPGYREILTGRRGDGCIDNRCPPIAEPTLLDELAAAGRAPGEVAEIASWEGLALAASAEPWRVLVSAGRHGGVTRALVAVDHDTSLRLAAAAVRHDYDDHHPDYRRDADTTALALAYLEAARPRFLHVALGDTDIHAHAGNFRGYLAALAAADDFVGQVGETLDRCGGESLVVVTADHGRGPDFRDHGKIGDGSAGTWLVAAGGPIAPQGRVRGTLPHRLADITPSLRPLLGLPPDESERAGHAIAELASPR